MEGFDSRFFNGAHHSLGLALGPRVIGLGQAALDAILLADAAEDVADPALHASLVALDELHALVGRDSVGSVGPRFDHNAQEGRCGEFGRLAIDTDEHELRGSAERHLQEALAAFLAQFGNGDMKVADLILLELLGLLVISFGLVRDTMVLQAAVQA